MIGKVLLHLLLPSDSMLSPSQSNGQTETDKFYWCLCLCQWIYYFIYWTISGHLFIDILIIFCHFIFSMFVTLNKSEVLPNSSRGHLQVFSSQKMLPCQNLFSVSFGMNMIWRSQHNSDPKDIFWGKGPVQPFYTKSSNKKEFILWSSGYGGVEK